MGVPTDDTAAIPVCRFMTAVAAGAAVRGHVTARIQIICSGKIAAYISVGLRAWGWVTMHKGFKKFVCY